MIGIAAFTVGNFLSFKDNVTIRFEATDTGTHPQNVYTAGEYKLLKSAVICEANSSGKSNLIKAMSFMKETVLDFSKLHTGDKFNIHSFLPDTESREKPSFFELAFLIGAIPWRYGFLLDNDQVHREWLYIGSENNQEDFMFVREKDHITVSELFPEGKTVENKIPHNALFLSVCHQCNIEIATSLLAAIEIIQISPVINHSMTKDDLVLWTDFSVEMKQILHQLNVGMDDTELDLILQKAVTDQYIYDQSSETIQLIKLALYLCWGLQLGVPVVFDGLDAKLQVLLLEKGIPMFHSPEQNPSNGQLIFNTHFPKDDIAARCDAVALISDFPDKEQI